MEMPKNSPQKTTRTAEFPIGAPLDIEEVMTKIKEYIQTLNTLEMTENFDNQTTIKIINTIRLFILELDGHQNFSEKNPYQCIDDNLQISEMRNSLEAILNIFHSLKEMERKQDFLRGVIASLGSEQNS